ncbi:MAG: hypothetical protein EOO43_10100 [Flavobacterium sp.]|nr:MAG: hypothetical protein EOO43_10100 [Flavobacterium sp.]
MINRFLNAFVAIVKRSCFVVVMGKRNKKATPNELLLAPNQTCLIKVNATTIGSCGTSVGIAIASSSV